MKKSKDTFLYGDENQEVRWELRRGRVKQCSNPKCPLKGKYYDHIHDHKPLPYSNKQLAALVKLHGEVMASEFITHFKEKEEERVRRANRYCQACRIL